MESKAVTLSVTPGRPLSLPAAVSSCGHTVPPALVQFQLGLFREVVRVPGENLSYRHAKRLALEIIERKAPDFSVVGAGGGEKILLFRHQLTSEEEQQLHRLTDQDALQDGDLIEVIIAGSAIVTEMKIRPHSLVVQSYRTPTFCHHCGEMLWGLVRQGLKCEGCALDFHKRCALQLANDCSRVRRQVGASLSLFPPRRPRAHSLSTQAGGSLEEISKTKPKSRPPSWAEPPVWLGVGGSGVPHTFHIHSYTKPTVCQYCHRLLKGLFRQGLQCSDCRFNCHRRCEPLVPKDCPGEKKSVNGEDSTASHGYRDEPEDSDESSLSSSSSLDDHDVMAIDENPLYGTMEAFPRQTPIGPCFSSYIPLMRLVQSVRHVKSRASRPALREGWLLHYTNTDTLRKRHYWILDWKSITLHQNENCTKYYKEIPLSEVLQVRGASELSTRPSLLPDDTTTAAAHSFEVVTASAVHCVIAGTDAQGWENALRQALMPMSGSGTSSGNLDNHDNAAQSGLPVDVSSVYQISTDEVLGSGQFGVVYGGTHRQTGRSVAIKVIDKTRFPTKQERQLRNEVAILQNLSHLGVVLLEGMFETVEYVFVVMEKLHGDMLEMILSSEKGRLPERNTRFLVMQILEALRYLHIKHIAHCDLKPENVLLASPDPFPQVKLCDFGFARIIGEKSFRRSVVGTPAYLAPEVISSHGYNRSLDMWSAGVITYVSLSGTFPFNEDEDIGQQITNASFMYPRQPWATISLGAVSLISNLLQVSVRRRFTVGRALGHPWLQDFQLWCDLREFEQRMGSMYLTHQGDEERWRRHAQEKGLDFPSHLSWDPPPQE